MVITKGYSQDSRAAMMNLNSRLRKFIIGKDMA